MTAAARCPPSQAPSCEASPEAQTPRPDQTTP
eukprot:CAMPEP_0113713142 /NCGR_PEP_ID=MMETSP0038_2-20120614/31813_1 /TAXON_ID=2898 /ORGANISM="Cryptomonas paramecium" /LENGTH=31 /DNA_ID=CAMNT_0000639807 /DNA_START=554 /DNA_END=646 /DNA_ORIENTATION=- /assembly_acc=CAM_ASM_000170